MASSPVRERGDTPHADAFAGDPAPAGAAGEAEARGSGVIGDVRTLLDDVSTWLDAEVAYHKTRAAFVADRLRVVVVSGVVAGVLGLVALIGLALGLILALTPLITAWGATAVVVGLLLLGAWLFVRRAAAALEEMRGTATEPANE